jgi:hypothetical protein
MTIKRIPVCSRAHRALRQLDRYKPLESKDRQDVLERFQYQTTCNSEELIGIYDNSDHKEALLIITDQGISLRENEGSWKYFAYTNIERVMKPKEKVDRYIDICLTDGTVSRVHIRGGEGPVRDSFAFYVFLRHVIKDISCND